MTLGPNEWPEGCLGYAFNLVRPCLRGYRAQLLYPMLGQALVSCIQTCLLSFLNSDRPPAHTITAGTLERCLYMFPSLLILAVL